MKINWIVLATLIQTHAPAWAQTTSNHKHENPPTQNIKEEPRAPVDIPSEQQSKIGLKVAKAEKKKLTHSIRTVGTITVDQTKEAHFHTKINGWVEKVFADSVGKPVRKGAPLFDLYSPELVSTQEEYLAALKQGEIGRDIAKAALARLELWGVPPYEIQRLKSSGKTRKQVPFVAPIDGYVIHKNAIPGMYLTPELEVYHIADLSTVWIIVSLYEFDLSLVSLGDEAQITFPYDPGRSLTGTVSYIYPEVDLQTRTAKARIELSNPDQKFKPGMFVNVELKKMLEESVVIPDDAIIDTGVRTLVFAKRGATRFEPREVKAGPRVGNQFAILSGLEAGEEVVTGASFLIDAESKLQAALKRGSSVAPGHSGHGDK